MYVSDIAKAKKPTTAMAAIIVTKMFDIVFLYKNFVFPMQIYIFAE